MKTNESVVKYVLRLTLTLLVITSLVAAALAAVNSVTAPVIAQLKAEKLQKAINEVLPGGGELVYTAPNKEDVVRNVYQSETGYAVEVMPTSGFNGAITMMVGIDPDGNILGISVVTQTETAGLGAVCAAKTEAGQKFRAGFEGLSVEVKVDKDGGEVDSITGATITSRAICDGVNAALSCVANMG